MLKTGVRETGGKPRACGKKLVIGDWPKADGRNSSEQIPGG